MEIKNSYLKNSLADYPESESISVNIFVNTFDKYKSQKNRRFLGIYIFVLFAIFLLIQTLVQFIFSKELFNVFSDRTSFSITFFKFIFEYIVTYGPILCLMGLLAIFITFYQDRDILNQV